MDNEKGCTHSPILGICLQDLCHKWGNGNQVLLTIKCGHKSRELSPVDGTKLGPSVSQHIL